MLVQPLFQRLILPLRRASAPLLLALACTALPQGAARRLGALRRKSTGPNSTSSLRDFVRTRRVRNGLNFGEKQTRRRMCQEASVAKTRKDESQ